MERAMRWVLPGLVGGLMVVAVGASLAAGEAKSLFDQHCATCHGKDGQAQTGTGKAMHIKPWRGDEELKKMSDERIRQVITEGVAQDGKRRMPPNRTLKPEQLDELVKDVRRLSK